MRKIAIMGMASFDGVVPEDHEVWIIAQYISYFTRYHRVFECHEDIEGRYHGDVCDMFLADPWAEFYVPEHLSRIYPNAELIPTEDMAIKYYRSFGSTISYMIVQAIHDKVDEIALYGVDMSLEDEYYTQRPSAYYWLGVANALGIKTGGLLEEEVYGLKVV